MEKEETKLVETAPVMSSNIDNEPEPKGLAFKHAFLEGLFAFGMTVLGFLIDIGMAFLNIFKAIGKFFMKAGKGLARFGKGLAHKWHFNDNAGRASFFVFGVSSLKHGQIVNGVLYILFEVGYLVGFAIAGLPNIIMFFSPEIGTGSTTQITVDEFGMEWEEEVPGVNGVVVLIFAILWLLSIALFFFVWWKSVNAGYNNYRIKNFLEFDRRTRLAAPLSEAIYEDLEETGLYRNGNLKELKVRYYEKYEEFDAIEGMSQMDKDWGHYILDNTILDCLEHHADLDLYTKKRDAMLEKAEAFDKKPSYVEKQNVAEGKYDILMKEYHEWMNLANEARAAGETDKAAANEAEARKIRCKALDIQNSAVNRRMRHNAKLEEMKTTAREYNAKITELEKTAACFARVVDVKNHSTYGKFNIFYLKKADLEKRKAFYEKYSEIYAEYQRGEAEFEKANEENVAIRAEIEAKHKENLAKIEEKFAGIKARRDAVLARYDEEKAKLQSGEIDEATYKYNCKTIKGIVLALPTPKEVAAMKKEELGNANHAFKRDYNGVKINYNAKTYAEFCATNYMIMELDFSYELAKSFLKDVAAGLDSSAASEKASTLAQEIESYVESNPAKYDGRPKTFVAQGRSMLDENFHLTLLALPVLGVIIFVLMPLLLSIIVGFTNYSHSYNPPTDPIYWIGFDNFAALFGGSGAGEGDGFVGALVSIFVWTMVWAVLATFTNYFLGIIYALMINKKGIKFKGFWRFVFVLSIAVPQFISLISISLMLSNVGFIDKFWLDTFGHSLGFAQSNVVVDELSSIPTKAIIILVNIWIGIPYTILQTSGILLNIPGDLYESSNIDGAGPGTQFFKITLPYILFVTGPSLIQTFIGNINNFGVIYFLTGGGPRFTSVAASNPIGRTDLFITYIYKLVTTAGYENYGQASAIGIIVFIICAFISMVVYNRSSSISKEDQFA